MSHSTRIKLTTADGTLIYLSRSRVDRLVPDFARYTGPTTAIMLFQDVREWRPRQSGDAGPTVQQLVRI